MKKLIVILCTLYLVLAYGTALAESPAWKKVCREDEVRHYEGRDTIKSALSNIPPAWSQTLQCDTTICPRFELVMGGAAVLDHETGLVWEQSPSTTQSIWTVATSSTCALREVGGRMGWHLPTIEQLASLLDKSVAGSPKLPAGHPFTNVQSSYYWSATTYANGTASAWVVNFDYGFVRHYDKTGSLDAWCVRGGQSHDAY